MHTRPLVPATIVDGHARISEDQGIDPPTSEKESFENVFAQNISVHVVATVAVRLRGAPASTTIERNMLVSSDTKSLPHL